MAIIEQAPEARHMKKKGLANPILIVEDDSSVSSLISNTLQAEGFPTICATDGPEGIAFFEKHDPILIILDLGLPKVDGFEVCQYIRKQSKVPIIMVTVKGDEFEKILGLTIGADDYITKPFSTRELTARVKAILRRCVPTDPGARKKIKYLDLEVDFEKCKIMVKNQEVKLTVYEFEILQALANLPGRVFSREQLIQKIYSYEDVSVVDRVIDVHIGNLRAKIEEDSSNPVYIKTVRGMGYKFADLDDE